MVECIRQWAYTRAVKDVSKKYELIRGLAYIHWLLLYLHLHFVLTRKNKAKTVFNPASKCC